MGDLPEKRSGTVGPTGELADAIVAQLCAVTRARTLEHALELGEIIAHGVFEGNGEAIEKQGDAHPLFRRIAGHRELPVSARRLWMCVKLFELVQRFPGLRRATHLGVAHLRAVFNLKPGVQERLLTQAEREGWTSERLEEMASSQRRGLPKSGRPPTGAFFRSIQRLEEITIEVQEELGPRVRGKIALEKARVAIGNLRRVRQRIDSLEAELERAILQNQSAAVARP